MTGFPKHTERSLWPSADDVRGAESVLGREHPLARAISLEHTFAIQSLAGAIAVLLGIAGTLRHVEIGSVVLGAAFAVELAFVAAALCARKIARDRVQDLIVDGSDGLVLPVVVRERRRLASRKVRESFARSLEQLLRDAQRWNEIFSVAAASGRSRTPARRAGGRRSDCEPARRAGARRGALP